MLDLKHLYDAYVQDSSFDELRSYPGVKFVPGSGPLNPTLMIVGEAPGRMENAKGQPFIGQSGIILRNLITNIGIDPNNVFFTNVVKYWPLEPDKVGVTRSPSEEEAEASRDYLLRELEIVDPDIVGLCGRFSINAVFPEITQVFAYHGELLEDQFVPLYHPAVIKHAPYKRLLVEKGFERLKNHILALRST